MDAGLPCHRTSMGRSSVQIEEVQQLEKVTEMCKEKLTSWVLLDYEKLWNMRIVQQTIQVMPDSTYLPGKEDLHIV